MEGEKKELKSVYESKIYCVHEHPYAYATLTNFGDHKGLLQVYSDWGIYSGFWPSMRTDSLAEFLLEMDAGYLARNLDYKLKYMGMKKSAEALLMKFMVECWPRLRELIKKETA